MNASRNTIERHTEMLKANKHFMATEWRNAPAVPQDVTPITLSILPMDRSADAEIVITVGEHIEVRVIATGERWIRTPERRSLSRRQHVAQNLRTIALLYSLQPFLTYIADCGFVVRS